MRMICPICKRRRVGVLFDIDSRDYVCPDGHHFSVKQPPVVKERKVDTGESLRGDTQVPDDPLLIKYKNKCNPSQEPSPSSRFTSMNPRAFERMTLEEIQDWSLSHSKFENPDGSRWKAPDCCVGVLRYNTTGRVAGFVPCNSWQCPTCGPRKKIQLKAKVEKAFGIEKVYMLTLTVNPFKVDDTMISHYFSLLRSAARRYSCFLPKLHHKYFWVKEFTPPSHPYIDGFGHERMTVGAVRHLHILVNFFMQESVIRGLWYKITGQTSDQVRFSTHEGGHRVGVSYILKYIDKGMVGELPAHHYRVHERRYGRSNGLYSVFKSLHLCWMQKLKGASTHSFSELLHLGLVAKDDAIQPNTHQSFGGSSGYGGI